MQCNSTSKYGKQDEKISFYISIVQFCSWNAAYFIARLQFPSIMSIIWLNYFQYISRVRDITEITDHLHSPISSLVQFERNITSIVQVLNCKFVLYCGHFLVSPMVLCALTLSFSRNAGLALVQISFSGTDSPRLFPPFDFLTPLHAEIQKTSHFFG